MWLCNFRERGNSSLESKNENTTVLEKYILV